MLGQKRLSNPVLAVTSRLVSSFAVTSMFFNDFPADEISMAFNLFSSQNKLTNAVERERLSVVNVFLGHLTCVSCVMPDRSIVVKLF